MRHYLSLGMFLAKLHGPNPSARADIKNSSHLGLGVVRGSSTQAVVKCEEPHVVLYVWGTQ